jgi:phospholipid transport system substrate-binding protein
MRRTLTGLAALVMLAALVVPARAGAPTDAVKSSVDRALAVLDDPALKGEAHAAERRARLREIANGLFDFEEMSRRALGPHWRERTLAEREKFVGLFADLLETTYFAKIDTYSGGGAVRYGAESMQADEATVRTTITTAKGTAIPADYRLHQRNGRWMVYDVSIEGVSLVNNYRAQFNQIIRAASYDELVQRLEKKALPGAKPPNPS